MLEQAGVGFRSISSDVDEGAEKAKHADATAAASALAEAKALAVSVSKPDAWVIGCDSVVTVDGRRFDKPRDRGEAERHLRLFSCKEMVLTSAAALARDGQLDWIHADSATLKVRTLSDAFIERYLDAEWPDVAYCVGVFRLEGRGIQLFERIEGSCFTILGMPLLPLLNALRQRGVIDS